MGSRTVLLATALVAGLAGCGGNAKDEAPPPLGGAGSPQVTTQAAATAARYPAMAVPSLAPWSHPARACEVLSSQGFRMGGWVPSTEATPGYDRQCVSEARAANVDSAYRMTYAAIGGAVQNGEAKAFVLRLTGPRPGPNLNAAREEFAGVVMTLADSGWAMSDTQTKDAAALKAAVKSGTPGSWPAGGFARVEVTQAAKTSEDLVVTFFHQKSGKPTKALEALR